MPILGADMAAGTLIAWRKKAGERVQRGDIIAEVETDKGLIEVEVFTAGEVELLLVPPGTKVPVGTVLAMIREEGVPAPGEVPVRAPAAELRPTAPPAPPTAEAPPEAVREKPARVRISPYAKKLAAELGIDPSAVRGTGPGGRITHEDILHAKEAAAAAPAPALEETERQRRMRQTIAAAMSRSKREIPHYYLSTEIDLARALEWLTRQNEKRSVEQRLVYGVLLIKAVALALREVPELNSVWVEGQPVPKEEIHVGAAISLRGGGLVAPALHHTDRQSLDELMHNFRDLVNRARTGGLRSSELSDPTITVTSLGERGVDSVFGIIYPPQVAIVGFGKITQRPRSIAGQVLSRPVITATLSGDHRVSDGHRGGLFLAAVDRLLQEPEQL